MCLCVGSLGSCVGMERGQSEMKMLFCPCFSSGICSCHTVYSFTHWTHLKGTLVSPRHGQSQGAERFMGGGEEGAGVGTGDARLSHAKEETADDGRRLVAPVCTVVVPLML